MGYKQLWVMGYSHKILQTNLGDPKMYRLAGSIGYTWYGLGVYCMYSSILEACHRSVVHVQLGGDWYVTDNIQCKHYVCSAQ